MEIRSAGRQRLVNLWLRCWSLNTAEDVYVARGSVLSRDLVIGNGTRINGPTYMRGQGAIAIGKYCAIAHASRFISANHAISGVNLQYALNRKLSVSVRPGPKIGIEVGHNVWLGDQVTILPGARIGNGAVIGAGSLVTGNVEAYAIYAGNPARKIRDRFPASVTEALETAAWWDWSIDRMRSARPLFEADLENTDPGEAVALISQYSSTATSDAS